MQRKPVHHVELEQEYLDIVAGGETKVLRQESHWGFPSYKNPSHHYQTLSDHPPGATTEDCNSLVNRFGQPTRDGLWGNGNDPNSTHGWVREAHTGAPLGSVTTDRGVDDAGHAWVRNTTDALHAAHGTVTRSVVDSPEGCRIQTDGEGQGAGPIPFLGNTRHYFNAQYGPDTFQQLDHNMIDHWNTERAARHDAPSPGTVGQPPAGDTGPTEQ